MPENFFRHFPGVIRIEPSSLCTLKCIHCPTGTVKISRGLMKSSTFDKILNNIRDNVQEIRVVVLYHGGEPLLNKMFPEMVKQVKELGIMHVKTDTNGTLLSDNLIKEICAAGLDEIVFSLDGLSFEQNDKIRRGCNGKQVTERIKRLVKYKKSKNLSKPEIFVATTQFLNSNQKIVDQTPTVPDYLKNCFSAEIREKSLSIKTTFAMKWPDMNVDEKYVSVVCNEEGPQIRNFCDDVINTVTIRWNGDIVPCCYDLTSKIILGNIHESNLRTIWNNEKYLKLRGSIHEKKFLSLCDECNIVKQQKFLLLKDNI